MKSSAWAILGIAVMVAAGVAGEEEAGPAAAPGTERMISLNFRDCPLRYVLEFYRDVTGKEITVDLGVVATITLKADKRVTTDEAIELITQALAEQGVTFEELDAQTLRVRGPRERDVTAEERPSYEERRRRRMEERMRRKEAAEQVEPGEGQGGESGE